MKLNYIWGDDWSQFSWISIQCYKEIYYYYLFFYKKKIMRLSFSSHELIFGRQMPERSLGGEKEKRGWVMTDNLVIHLPLKRGH